MDEISHDIGVELHTESLLLRAEQLSRLESDKLVDKVIVVNVLVIIICDTSFFFESCFAVDMARYQD